MLKVWFFEGVNRPVRGHVYYLHIWRLHSPDGITRRLFQPALALALLCMSIEKSAMVSSHNLDDNPSEWSIGTLSPIPSS